MIDLLKSERFFWSFAVALIIFLQYTANMLQLNDTVAAFSKKNFCKSGCRLSFKEKMNNSIIQKPTRCFSVHLALCLSIPVETLSTVVFWDRSGLKVQHKRNKNYKGVANTFG